jgi:hypothetical protein
MSYWFHKQNLNEKSGERMGSIWAYGRCWWRWGNNKCIGLEWSNLTLRTHFRIKFGSEYSEKDFLLAIAIPLISFYLTFENVFPRKWRLKECEKEISVSIHDGALWWSFWNDTMSWSSRTPKWRWGNWNPMDTFLGKIKYSEREFNNKDIEIPMPEKSYLANVVFKECTWKRPLWFAERIIRANVDIPEGIPVPGKGENSWDCGQDAIYSSCFPAKTLQEVIGKMVESAMRDRIKYGGLKWRPILEGDK